MRLEDLPVPLPRDVRETYDEILKGTGQAPDIERRDNGRRYRMSVESDRVRMQIDYKLTGHRWIWAASQLYVDGVQRPIMDSPQRFFLLWHDPDGNGYERVDPDAEPVIEPYPLEDAPPELRTFVETILTKAETGVEGCTFGRIGTVPVVRLTRGGRVLLVWLKQAGPVWMPHAIRLTEDGYNHTPTAGTSFDEAMAMFLGDRTGPAGVPSGGPKVGGAHAPARLTGVEVRKQSVMRI